MARSGVEQLRGVGGPVIAAFLLAFLLAGTGVAGAATYTPKRDRIFAGVSDTGAKRDYHAFTDQIGAHVPLMQSFEVWGGVLRESAKRWLRTETRGVLSISTSPCYECAGVISPRQIAAGHGDSYLLRLNSFLAEWGSPVYVRLLPEMNGHWNPYAAFEADGTSRGPSHSTRQFRRAWKRTAIVVRGGARSRVNRRLRRQNLSTLAPGAPRRLAKPKVSFMWVPQTHGSPRIHANRPAAYWPGRQFVDWVGADIYGSWPNFAGLNRFYRSRKRFPFAIGEWSPWQVDDPAFTRRLHRWLERKSRAKMILYYQGFGENNPFMLSRFPASAKALARIMRSERYQRYAPGSRRHTG